MNNYNEGKIYEIVCNITGKRYIGSTVQPLEDRLSLHKCITGCSSRQIIAAGNYSMNLLEAYPCTNRTELRKKEQEYFDKLDCINERQPFRSIEEKKEYYTENTTRILEQNKQYKLENADKILEQNKQYYIDNKDKIKQYRVDNKDKIKQYYTDNKDKVLEKQRQYRLKKKEAANFLKVHPY